jgi:hypothetical protein
MAGYNNTKEEVRTASHFVILEIYQIVGRKEIMQLVGSLKKS